MIRIPNLYVVYNAGRNLYWPESENTLLTKNISLSKKYEYGNDAKEKAEQINKRNPTAHEEWSAYKIHLEKI